MAGCPADVREGGATDGDTEAIATSDGHLCHPGTSMACACTNGATGSQACAADGQSYGACECDVEDGSGEATSSTSNPSTDATTDPTPESTGGEATTGADSSGDTTTSIAECEPDETMECDCGDGRGFATCIDGQFAPCECCMGSHPIVEGDVRYCDTGRCYCGDPTMSLDACFPEPTADPCCPVDLECY
jgi:hypothetical protein